MVSNGTKQFSREGKIPAVIINYDFYEPQQQPSWYNNSKGAVMALIFGGRQQFSNWI